MILPSARFICSPLRLTFHNEMVQNVLAEFGLEDSDEESEKEPVGHSLSRKLPKPCVFNTTI